MELRHFRYFLAVAEERHFTRAAQRLGISQPPLSQQIRQFEAEVGAVLFHRLPHGVALTEAGERLLQDARTILRDADKALDNARRAARGEWGVIRIGFTSSASFHPFVTGAIRDYRLAYPEVRLELIEANTVRLFELFQAEQLNAAFIRPAPGESGALGEMPLFREEMLVALPADHRLAAQPRVALTELADETFILYPRRNGRALYDDIVGACQAAGFNPHVEQEAPQMASTITLVATGLGISIVPASMKHLAARGVTYRPIDGEEPRAAMSLVHFGGGSPAATRAFVGIVEARLEREQAGKA
ncbi:LysR family transcriptional regulator [Aliidongia dinghuensis]|uniref:LysR family transcriptional regulator n=1 Tax=Aliidongia dinghuensis TaxID=1867774 RepID=A0A8J2YSD2_9PROT|nr:LysR family transcriptional regulator [Aliidongia dinghuensis]GGF14631.1 LysR family transcriptional regulator [Aliidongia dinghuensis]